MKTLKDAWDWYEQAKTNLYRMQRLDTLYWDEGSMGTHNSFQHRSSSRKMPIIGSKPSLMCSALL